MIGTYVYIIATNMKKNRWIHVHYIRALFEEKKKLWKTILQLGDENRTLQASISVEEDRYMYTYGKGTEEECIWTQYLMGLILHVYGCRQ